MTEHVYQLQLTSSNPDNNNIIQINILYSDLLQGAIDILIPEANLCTEFKKAKVEKGKSTTKITMSINKDKMPYLLLLSQGIIGAIKDYADFHELPVDELTGTSLN